MKNTNDIIKEAPESSTLSRADNLCIKLIKNNENLPNIPEFEGIDPEKIVKYFSLAPFHAASNSTKPDIQFYINYTDLAGLPLNYPNPSKSPNFPSCNVETLPFYRARMTDGRDRKYTQPRRSPRYPFLGGLVVFEPVINWEHPIIIVEGEKKAFVLCSKGIPAIGIPGINGFYKKSDSNDSHRFDEDFYDLVFEDILKDHRSGIVLVHDGDALDGDEHRKAYYYSSVKVFNELFEAMHIPLAYCMVKPNLNCKGIDDAYYKNPNLQFKDLVNKYDMSSPNILKTLHQLFFPTNLKPVEIVNLLVKSEDYVSKGGIIYTYLSDYWQLVPDYGPLEKKIFEMLGNESTYSKIKDTLRMFTIHSQCEKMNLGADEGKLTVENGILDIKSGKLLEHSSRYLNNYKFNVHYIPESTCPRWLKFLDEVFADDYDKDQKIQFLKCFFGLCLTTDVKHQTAVLLSGHGGNGKGVLLNIISSILEPAQACLTMNELGIPNRVLELLGKTFCYHPDLPKQPFNEGVFKSAVVGEKLPMKKLYLDSFTAHIRAKFCFAANYLPHTKDTSDAYFRRWVIIEFNKSFTGCADLDLVNTLMNEKPGIFNWMLEGLMELEEIGKLPEPESSKKAVGSYLIKSSSVEAFIESPEWIEKTIYEKVLCQEIYKAYLQYCRESGFKTPLAKNNFFDEFTRRANIKKDRGAGNQLYFMGVRLLRKIDLKE